MTTIPTEYADLLERPVVVALATTNPNGQTQVHPVWVDYHDGYLRVNTARGRQKDKNLHGRRQATILFVDPENPYRYLEVRGKVIRETEEGAAEHIDQLCQKYTGRPKYPRIAGETRVMYTIAPERVTVMSPRPA